MVVLASSSFSHGAESGIHPPLRAVAKRRFFWIFWVGWVLSISTLPSRVLSATCPPFLFCPIRRRGAPDVRALWGVGPFPNWASGTRVVSFLRIPTEAGAQRRSTSSDPEALRP